jgi:hypothetical protein
MKTAKIKRYRLGVSRNFPTTHVRKGEQTCFVDKIMGNFPFEENKWKKIHTIRSNYELWAKRMAEVQAGRAVVELFYWSGKPYHKDENGIGQVVFATLDKDSGCGVQKAEFDDYLYSLKVDYKRIELGNIPQNDGLSHADFEEWFKKYDLSKPMAIIHFTSFRY